MLSLTASLFELLAGGCVFIIIHVSRVVPQNLILALYAGTWEEHFHYFVTRQRMSLITSLLFVFQRSSFAKKIRIMFACLARHLYQLGSTLCHCKCWFVVNDLFHLCVTSTFQSIAVDVMYEYKSANSDFEVYSHQSFFALLFSLSLSLLSRHETTDVRIGMPNPLAC